MDDTPSAQAPAWSVADARQLRNSVTAQLARKHRIARCFSPVVQAAYRVAGVVTQGQTHRRVLARTAARMNRNTETAFRDYTPGQGDIIASAYFKAGTNWVMHTCHQIAHHGQAEFDHIQDVIPWPDAGQPRFWINLHDTAPYKSPTGQRVIKSHLSADHVPPTADARYVIVTRDPKDCAASGYHFFQSLLFGPTTPPPDEWLAFFAGEDALFGPWSQHVASWYALRAESNVLFLHFEDMKKDPSATVDTLAHFLGVSLSADARERVIDKTQFSAMKAINHKFYPASQSVWSQPGGSIIRGGRVGDSSTLFSANARARFDDAIAAQLEERASDYPYATRYGNAQPTGSYP